MKKVIDADNNKLLEEFKEEETDEKETDSKVKYYESLEKWDDISVDRNGDIILWEEE